MRFVSILSALAAVTFASTAAAEDCAPRTTVVQRLGGGHGEVVVANGLVNQMVYGTSHNAIVEVWSNDETGSFTITITHPSGFSCVVTSGTDFYLVRSGERVIEEGVVR